MDIQMTDLKVQYEAIKNEIDAAIKDVIAGSNFILGKQVSLLEEEIAAYLGVRYAVGVASGTDALVLSLAGMDIGKDKEDEVITTPFTFIATAEAIARVGARPVFCDIDEKTYALDLKKLEAKITKHTKAIIPVHLYGRASDMDALMACATSHGVKVVEDCAQSFGSEHRGRKVGSFGECGCFSFFPAKTLGCFGDAGMIVTGDEKLAKDLAMLRDHGSSSKDKYTYSMHGFNSRLDALQAAILRVKLKYLDSWIRQRIKNAEYYNKQLAKVPQVITPEIPKDFTHTFNYYTIRIKNRNAVHDGLQGKGIATGIYYPKCLHEQDVFNDLGYTRGDFPIAEKAQDEVLSLPMYPELPKKSIELIAAAVKECL